MKVHELRFRIAQTQRAQQVAVQTALLVTLFAVVAASVAPQLLYEYVLQSASIDTQLTVLRYFPLATYGTAFVVFVAALIKNFLRGRAIKTYEQELMLLAYAYADSCGDCGQCICECSPMTMNSENNDFAAAIVNAEEKKSDRKATKKTVKAKTAKKSVGKKSTKKSK